MMKKILIIPYIVILSFLSCKNASKKEKSIETQKQTVYQIDNTTTEIEWTGYKTSSKIPVKGTFKKINIKEQPQGKSPSDALNNLTFSIPVSSIFSGDPLRDSKLQKFFFNVMKDTEFISGIVHINDNNKGEISLTMNSQTHKLPFTYTIQGNKFNLQAATLYLNEWNAKNALETLHKECEDLHKGLDGISKTWDQVGISLTTEIINPL